MPNNHALPSLHQFLHAKPNTHAPMAGIEDWASHFTWVCRFVSLPILFAEYSILSPSF